MKAPQLNWKTEGSGPVVVLSHALGCDLGMWDGVAKVLGSHYTVLRYDHRGHGRSEPVPGPYSMDMLADDAARLITAECAGPVHFVGLSMGGMTAQALAVRHPQLVKTITIANAAMFYDDAARAMWMARVETVKSKGMEAIADGALQRWFTPEFRADEQHGGAARVAELRARLVRIDVPAYAASCEAVAAIDFRQSNQQIRCPALVIAGARDEATPPAMSELIRASIPGAQLQSVDAAHLSAVEKPDAFAAALMPFLQANAKA
jgi:3-oxoadipate enol-lactonase